MSTSMTRFRRGYERSVNSIEESVKFLERRYTPLGRFSPGPFQGWGFLWQPALVGFVALTAILAGASFSNSPFKLETPHTWFFGVPTQPVKVAAPTNEMTLILGIVLVFGGLFLLMRVWLRLAEVMRMHQGAPLSSMWKILGLWSIPMIIAPPLFSRDVFSYAAQGEMTARHITPYLNGPFSLGSGPFVTPVDPLWGNVPAPYGPFFLFLDSSVVRITGHRELWSVVGLRVLEVLATVLLGVGLVMLARALNRDPGEAFVLGALNPLVLLTLIGGVHNDALMAGFLVIGIAFAVQKRPILGIVFCATAAAIKAPAALGIIYIAWTWLGPGHRVREKVRPMVVAGAITGVILVVFTTLAGFGFGWVKNLATPGTVRSWSAPATGSAMLIHWLLNSFGISIALTPILTVTRLVGLAAAVLISIWLLWNAEQRGWVRSLGLSLVLFVVLGPVVQPWYLVWGLVLLAASYVGREHFWLLALTIVSPFLGLPAGQALLRGLIHLNAAAMIGCVAILLSTILIPMGDWTQWSWQEVTIREQHPLDAG